MSADKRLLRTLRAGDIIVYLARPEDRPVDPNKEWRGKVLHVCVEQLCMFDHVTVESLELDEEGLTEIVYPQQIVRKESEQNEGNEPVLPSPLEPPPAPSF